MSRITTIIAVAAFALAGAALAEEAKPKKAAGAKTTAGKLMLYEGQKFQGDRYEVDGTRNSLTTEFTIGSIAVHPGERWEVCEGARFKEPCMTVDGETVDLGRITIRSARPAA